jgi:hypothetical protein
MNARARWVIPSNLFHQTLDKTHLFRLFSGAKLPKNSTAIQYHEKIYFLRHFDGFGFAPLHG